MAKQGDEVPIVLEVRSATASDEHEKYAGFSLRTTQGETNFCISFPHLGILVTQALQLSQQHAKELNRPVILGGAVTAIDIIPESIAVSFQDVDGNRQRRLVVMIGDFCLSLQVDDELLAETLQGLSGPATPLVKRPAVSFPIDASGELKIPTHRTAKTPYETSALPVKWAPYAGFITVLWGHFETRLVELTNLLMLKNMTAPVIRRDRKDFSRKRQLFLAETAKTFASHPHIVTYCAKLADDAAKIHIARNLLVHGRLHGSVEGQNYILTAEGNHAGRPIFARFQEPELITLYHEIGNLCGRIGFLFDPDDSPRKPQPFSSDEKRFLRELQESARPTLGEG